MTPSRPYLLRALYEWILDNSLTPHLLVDAEQSGVEVPRQFVENGRIVLNVAPRAVQALVIDNDDVVFEARFSGQPMQVRFPVQAVLAIYAKENGQGMIFPADGDEGPEPPEGGPEQGGGRPHLKVVK